jgi:hypothetical protein
MRGGIRAKDPTGAHQCAAPVADSSRLAIGLFEKTRPGSRAWALERKTLEENATTNGEQNDDR